MNCFQLIWFYTILIIILHTQTHTHRHVVCPVFSVLLNESYPSTWWSVCSDDFSENMDSGLFSRQLFSSQLDSAAVDALHPCEYVCCLFTSV